MFCGEMKEGRHDRDNISIPDIDAAANAEVREICGPTVSQKGATVISAFVKKFFHRQTKQYICNKIVIEHLTAPCRS